MQSVSATKEETQAPAHLTETIVDKLKNPSTSSDFDLHEGVNQVLADVGMSAADSGGQLTFYGQDPIVPSRIRFATTAGIGLAAKTIAAAAIWRDRTGQGQDIHVDIRKAFRRFSGFFDGIWETVNGRSPAMGVFENSPFLKFPLFRETRDGRHITCLSFYPKAHQRALNFFRCSDSLESLQNSILQWRADDLEVAAAEEGLILGKVRTFEEFSKELQYTEVLAKMPLISVEKIGESDPVPFKPDAKAPLDGIRAFGMGHVIAGAGMGRDLAFYGADVLNIWRPDNAEVEAFFWDVQVGMRSTILDSSKEDRAKFDTLLKDADIFFANKRPGYSKSNGLDAEELCAKKPGLIHASIVLHGETGPWSNRPGFDETGATVAGIFAAEGSLASPKQPPIKPICDNVVGWLGTVGILAALRRRAVEGGSYKVVVSLTRTVLWQLSLGLFDKTFAQTAAGSTEERTNVAPDVFTAETPLGTYQGLDEQVYLSKSPGSFRTVLVPRGSNKPEWRS
jgi:crotonobetainyl-CoA:carnitine CoA-transferase CaiB-like acyl-CoA transferase